MYNGIRAQGGVTSGGAIYSVYFVLVMVFGNCILFTLVKKNKIKKEAFFLSKV